MNIVLLEADSLGQDIDLSIFKTYGNFTAYNNTQIGEVPERIRNADILIVNKLPMNQSTLAEATRLKLICVTATGTNNIDFTYTDSHHIIVNNAVGYSTASVAQHTFALYFYVAEKLRYYDDFVRTGSYITCPSFTHFSQHFHELDNKVWGIIGLGSIGRKTALAATGFGCRVIYYSTSDKNFSTDYPQVDFNTLLDESDVISIHCPLTKTTENLMDQDAFSKMKSSAILINVARGPIVNELDLAHALENGHIAGAGLDVLSQEPMKKDNPLWALRNDPRLFITPHIGWAATESRNRLIDVVCSNINRFLEP